MFLDNGNENNNVIASGTLNGNFSFSHEAYGEKFYENTLNVARKSGVVDKVPIMVSERLVCVREPWEGQRVAVSGSFRSYNKNEQERSRLILHLFAREFMPTSSGESDGTNVVLNGYVCKEPLYRETPLGREICDILLAVNRRYLKSDYIPCICWGRNARFSSMLSVGAHLKICGRIQSREFLKIVSETKQELRTAYEVSINKLEVIEDAEQEDD